MCMNHAIQIKSPCQLLLGKKSFIEVVNWKKKKRNKYKTGFSNPVTPKRIQQKMDVWMNKTQNNMTYFINILFSIFTSWKMFCFY